MNNGVIDPRVLRTHGEVARWHRPADGSSAVLRPNGVLCLRLGHFGQYTPICECSSLRVAERRLADLDGGTWQRRPSHAFESNWRKNIKRKRLPKDIPLASKVYLSAVLVRGLWVDSGNRREDPDGIRRRHRVRQYHRQLWVEGVRLFEPGTFTPT